MNYRWKLKFKCGPKDPFGREIGFWFLMRGSYKNEKDAKMAMDNLFLFNNYDGCREATHGKIIHPCGGESIFENDNLAELNESMRKRK